MSLEELVRLQNTCLEDYRHILFAPSVEEAEISIIANSNEKLSEQVKSPEFLPDTRWMKRCELSLR